ncbi:hypothetical protein [Roseospira visakhapatnamensis]|uniref:Tetratricopeptide repeat protein n=1 Tax=Roseospira visakhapatnamensis TaxID=390880 RepID=A0A7W6RDH3_9PROT|nr:hypothetical protein [Roseospira visakhapatnamensis]MBB4266437.1 hypothetical protein [Roseospira visakhapatnamensis]
MTGRAIRARLAALGALALAGLAMGRLGWAVAGPEPLRTQAEAHFRAAVTGGESGRLHAAADAWKDALAWSPADPFAWTGLAWAEALRGAPAPYVARLMARSAMLSPHVPALRRARHRWSARTPPPAAPGW